VLLGVAVSQLVGRGSSRGRGRGVVVAVIVVVVVAVVMVVVVVVIAGHGMAGTSVYAGQEGKKGTKCT
jgi:hypothetical protein